MAQRLAEILAQINSVHQLDAVVSAMRGIAASHAVQSRGLLPGIHAHAAVISAAIGEALTLLPSIELAAPTGKARNTALMLFCAEQGFAGGFSERVLDAAGKAAGDQPVFLIGTRGRGIAAERGIRPVWSAPMPTQVGAIPAFANRISDALYERVSSEGVTDAEIVFSQSEPGRISVVRRTLLPVDVGSFAHRNLHQPPLITLAPEILLERLAAEYVFVQICEAAMSAFAAENEARIVAMSAAKVNVDRTLDALRRRERQVRQEETTTEVVELAAGTEAVTKSSRASTSAGRIRQN